MSNKAISPIIFLSKIFVEKPPDFETSLAAKLQAAITEGSSVTIGTVYSTSFIKKLGATPNGKENVPILFSIICPAISVDRFSFSFNKFSKSLSIISFSFNISIRSSLVFF